MPVSGRDVAPTQGSSRALCRGPRGGLRGHRAFMSTPQESKHHALLLAMRPVRAYSRDSFPAPRAAAWALPARRAPRRRASDGTGLCLGPPAPSPCAPTLITAHLVPFSTGWVFAVPRAGHSHRPRLCELPRLGAPVARPAGPAGRAGRAAVAGGVSVFYG